MENGSLRAACIHDAEQIAQIYNFYIENSTATMEITSITSAEMAKRIADIQTMGWFLISEDKGRILGYAYAKPWHSREGVRFTYESSIYLAPDCPTQVGIGSKLYQSLLEQVKNSRKVAVLLGVITTENQASLHFHEKMGFSHVATLENTCFKSGRWLGMAFYRLDFNLEINTP